LPPALPLYGHLRHVFPPTENAKVIAATSPGGTLDPQLKVAAAAFALLVVVVGLFAAWRYRSQIASLVRTFFSEPGQAFNLAVFRIVFYAAAFPLLNLSDDKVERFASLPRDLSTAPQGFGAIAPHVPLSTTLVHWSYVVIIVSSVLAAIGLLTRIASIAYLVAVCYYLTIPQLFKVSHYHIVVWVAAIFVFSRTADVWSVDSVIRARRDARRGRPLVPAPARRYSRPLRMTWLLLAMTYLGPGLWKYRDTGFQWISATNMRGILYDKWYELGGWRPFVPVDKSGFLLAAGALMTMVFELSFFFLIWHRVTRLIAAGLGLFFHTMTYVSMRIAFWSQVSVYVSFVDWYRLSHFFFARRRQPLVFCYDAGCGVCRTTATALSRISLPAGVEFVPAADAARSPVAIGTDVANLHAEIHVFTPDATYRGFDAYRRLAWRIPVLWPLLLLAYLPPVPSLGRRLYRSVSERRACAVEPVSVASRAPAGRRGWRDRAWVVLPTAVGAVILAFGLVAIPREETHGWPFALYPTFAGLWAPESQQLTIQLSRSDGTRANISLQSCFPWMTSDRYAAVVANAVARARSGQPEVLRSLVGAASRSCPTLEKGRDIVLNFYSETVATTPAIAGRVLSRHLLLRNQLTTQ
jgi:predicted DCC family thiol-disulfide oxidoreductase YuxK